MPYPLFRPSAGAFLSAEEVGSSAQIGDLIEFQRGKTYNHWGVFIGDDFVGNDENIQFVPCLVHYSDGPLGDFSKIASVNPSGFDSKSASAVVRKEPFFEVVGASKCRVNNSLDSKVGKKFEGEEVKARALKEIGKAKYSLWMNNCEHFANWCRYDVACSQQTSDFYWIISLLTMATVVPTLVMKFMR